MFEKQSHVDPSISSGMKTVVDPYCDGGTSPPQPTSDIVPGATPTRRRGKSMSRRVGQSGKCVREIKMQTREVRPPKRTMSEIWPLLEGSARSA
jgi:hypothetical protein